MRRFWRVLYIRRLKTGGMTPMRITKHKRRCLMRTFAIVTASIAFSASAAPSICDWEVTVLDGKTREIRSFRPGSSATELPLPRIKGFKSCIISPVKRYEVNFIKATRIDFWCFTTVGDAVNVGSVASSQFGTDVTTFQLLEGPVTFGVAKDGSTEVSTSGYVELSAVCK